MRSHWISIALASTRVIQHVTATPIVQKRTARWIAAKWNSTKGVYREEGMQLTMTVRTQQTLYQRPDMLKIESSIRT